MLLSKIKEVKTLHTNFNLRRRSGDHRQDYRQKVRSLFWGNKKPKFENDSFSPVAEFTVAKAIMCLELL